MVRHVLVVLSDEDYEKAKRVKGERTWRDVLLGGDAYPRLEKQLSIAQEAIENINRALRAQGLSV